MADKLERIAATNDRVNAIVALRPAEQLLAEAQAADRADPVGPLHGEPIAIKDLAETKGIVTTFGSPIFKSNIPDQDCGLVRRLRGAGAIIIGKTNTPEFGLGSHSYNPVYGVTRTPYDLGRTAGGSSGGAAAALAAGMVDLADGSDMMGSLRNPAAFCNVYGMRPSWGTVPADPEGDMFLGLLATEGPMARDPQGLARVLGVLAQVDPLRPFGRLCPDLSDLSAAPVGRIGWLGDWGGAFPMEAGIVPLVERGLAEFERLGWHCESVGPLEPAESLWKAWIDLRSWSVAAKLGKHYTNPEHRPLLKPEAIWEIERGFAMSAMEVHHASERRSAWYRAAMRAFERFDVLVLPTAQVWPFPAEWHWPERINDVEMDSYHRWMQVVVPAGLIGLPAINLPCGFGENGLPMGMQVIGKPGADLMLLKLAQAYHERTDWPANHPPNL